MQNYEVATFIHDTIEVLRSVLIRLKWFNDLMVNDSGGGFEVQSPISHKSPEI